MNIKRLLLLVAAMSAIVLLSQCRHSSSAQDVIPTFVEAEMASANAPQQIEPGLPIVGDHLPLQVLRRRGYVAGYDPATRLPRWVMWTVTSEKAQLAESLPGTKRNYHEDTEVPSPRATRDDYKGVFQSHGLAHGHICPAADCKWDPAALDESNLLTNICPQDRSTNNGVWNQIEQATRRWARKHGCVWVVSGPLLYRVNHTTIGPNRVVVPEAFYKVILRLGDEPACIAYVCKNGDSGRRAGYVNTLKQVERLTGFSIFPNLPAEVRKRIENRADEGDW